MDGPRAREDSMTQLFRGRTRRLALAVAVAACSMPATMSARAQDCVGFLERTIDSGGVNGVNSVSAADLDGDGDLDVISASHNDNKIAWFENDGATPPSFVERVISTNARGASSIFAVDLDGDADVDVLSTSRNDNKVVWYENDGMPTPGFRERPMSSDAKTPLSVFAADLDGDTDVDALAAYFGSNTVTWFENVAAVFTEHEVTVDAPGAASVWAADLDGDTDNDLIVAAQLADTVSWFENDGASQPSFTEHVVSSTAQRVVVVAAANLDGDSDMDILAGSIGDNELNWYENQGGSPPTFTKRLIDTPGGPRSIRPADLDDDGDVDVLVASDLDDTIAWYENQGGSPPDFVQHVISGTTVSADSVFAGDVDGDGSLDVLSASSTPGTTLTQDKLAWYENDGAAVPTFAEQLIAASANGAEDADSGDLDGDGDLDLVVAAGEDDVLWYENDGTAVPPFDRRDASPPATVLNAVTTVVVFDMDGDLDLDVVAASLEDDLVVWRENDGASPPSFVEHPVASGVDSPRGLFPVDLDDDGDVDVLSASFEDDKIAWHSSDGADPPVFTEHVISSTADGATSVWADDLDGDGDLDVLSASFEDDKIAWYESDGAMPPTFTEREISTGSNGATVVLTADIDGDGDPDVVNGAAVNGQVAWWENQPDDDTVLAFTGRLIASILSVSSMQVIDVDDDSDLDVVSMADSGRGISWHEHNGQFPPVFTEHRVAGAAEFGRGLVAEDLNADDLVDMAGAFASVVSWYEQAGEICELFDASGDGVMDGDELAWMARAFGSISDDPASEWWFAIDYNRDGVVDGDDLAILGDIGVWGRGIDNCFYSCR